MHFEWDPAKAAQNRRKHRISFEEAAAVFAAPLAMTYPDPDHSISEQRFITVGLSTGNKVVVVAHTDRGDITRILSAPRATKRERKFYEEEN